MIAMIWGATATTIEIARRKRWCLEPIRLRRSRLSGATDRLRRMCEWLYMMRVKHEVVEVRNLRRGSVFDQV